MSRADIRRSNAGKGTHDALGGRPSQRKGRAQLEMGFEGEEFSKYPKERKTTRAMVWW